MVYCMRDFPNARFIFGATCVSCGQGPCKKYAPPPPPSKERAFIEQIARMTRYYGEHGLPDVTDEAAMGAADTLDTLIYDARKLVKEAPAQVQTPPGSRPVPQICCPHCAGAVFRLDYVDAHAVRLTCQECETRNHLAQGA